MNMMGKELLLKLLLLNRKAITEASMNMKKEKLSK